MSSNRWLVLVLVCFAQFMVVLDATITNVALPSIQQDLGFSNNDLQWVINGYTLLFGGFLLLGGRAADLFGRKRLFLAGIALFSAASLACGLATDSTLLIIARAMQGLGAALVSPRGAPRSSPRRSPRAPSARRPSACGPASRPAAARSACSSAAC
jgi:MFS family permease